LGLEEIIEVEGRKGERRRGELMELPALNEMRERERPLGWTGLGGFHAFRLNHLLVGSFAAEDKFMSCHVSPPKKSYFVCKCARLAVEVNVNGFEIVRRIKAILIHQVGARLRESGSSKRQKTGFETARRRELLD